MKKVDATGKRFGKLVAIKRIGVVNKNSIWECNCDCGRVITIPLYSLKRAKSCGCVRSSSLVGRRFGKLTVVARLDEIRKNHNTCWRCVCDCGKMTDVKRTCLIEGDTKSCGCLQAPKGKLSHLWIGCGDISKSFFNRIVHHAERRNIKIDLDMNYLWKLFLEQNGICALSGMNITLPSDHHNFTHGGYSASLDRIDSNRAYEVGNVQWVHKHVNVMKRDFEQDYFVELCGRIARLKHSDASPCLHKDGAVPHHLWRGVGELSKTYYNAIVNGAKARKIGFYLDMNYMWRLFEQQGRRCSLSGESLSMTRSRKPGTASLDRIDSSKDYIEGNVQWLHKDVNLMKQNLPDQYFVEMCKSITWKMSKLVCN